VCMTMPLSQRLGLRAAGAAGGAGGRKASGPSDSSSGSHTAPAEKLAKLRPGTCAGAGASAGVGTSASEPSGNGKAGRKPAPARASIFAADASAR
jgi:hypothetical protein